MPDQPKIKATPDPTFDAVKDVGKQIIDFGKLTSGYTGVKGLGEAVKKVTGRN